MDPKSTATALSAASRLHDGVRALQDAVAASKHNIELMRDIANEVSSAAPALKPVLLKAVLSNDTKLDKAFTFTINNVVDEVAAARRVIYSWLLKGWAARLLSAQDMRWALVAVRVSLVTNLGRIRRLQVDRVYSDEADTLNSAAAARVSGHVARLQRRPALVQPQQQAAVEAVVAELQGVGAVQDGASVEAVMDLARAEQQLAAKVGAEGQLGCFMCHHAEPNGQSPENPS